MLCNGRGRWPKPTVLFRRGNFGGIYLSFTPQGATRPRVLLLPSIKFTETQPAVRPCACAIPPGRNLNKGHWHNQVPVIQVRSLGKRGGGEIATEARGAFLGVFFGGCVLGRFPVPLNIGLFPLDWRFRLPRGLCPPTHTRSLPRARNTTGALVTQRPQRREIWH
jgi:hypothetical protein